MPPKTRKPTTAPAAVGAAADRGRQLDGEPVTVDSAPEAQPKPQRASARQGKAKAADSGRAQDGEEPPKAVKPRASKRKRADVEEAEGEDENQDSKPTKAAPAKKQTRASRPAAKKRQEEGHEDEEPKEERPAKKPRVAKPASQPTAKKGRTATKKAAAEPVPKKTAAQPALEPAPEPPAPKRVVRHRGPGARTVPINEVPSKQLDIFVFGEGSSGELGLGSLKYDGKKPIDVKRPRINHNLKGVVDIACGGMHCIALTHDQRVLTWGVNDDKALGRDTFWEGGTRDVDDASDDDDDDDTGINPKESTPGLVDLSLLPEETRIVQVAATDSASFILTDDGWVYGWGTFRGSDGIIGFNEDTRIQPIPTIIPGLKGITRLACGSNHVLAVDLNGKVFSWGSGGQYQLGRKPLTRHGGPSAGLNPQPCGKFSRKHRAIFIGAGSYHSFYIDDNHQVWAWGLNNYAQTGLRENTGEDDAMVLQPQIVSSLEDQNVQQIVGGEHHSVARTADGKLLTWGRVDGHQVGHPTSLYTKDNAVFDDNGKPRILLEPTAIEGIKTKFVAAGTDTSFAVDEAGKVYSWGFSANYQTGQGTTDDIEVPTPIDNSAIRDRQIIWAGAGGQFSVVAAAAQDESAKDELPNGN
ncbi:RCC1/BLIP-II protein [Hypoxylon sp. EC38]|nr:RCC1/BLIP-II protein [Hypoxylon sp. EC38]